MLQPFRTLTPSRRFVAIAVAWLWTTLGAGNALGAADDTVTLNFVNADVEAVIKAVSEITGRNFVLDPKVKGTINIVSTRPVPRDLVYPTLLSALRMQGFAAVEASGVVKIVPEVDAKTQGAPVVTRGANVSGDRLVTQVYALTNESAVQLVNVLRPLITPNNTIAAYPNGNALVITDYAENLRRIDRIIASLDVPPAGEPVIVPLRYASAIDLVQTLNRLLADAGAPQQGPNADPSQRSNVVADARSNSVLIRAESPARAARIRALAEQLDTAGRAGGNIFIIYLKNAEAVRVAQTLRGLLGGGAGNDSGSSSSGSGASTLQPLTSPTSTSGAASGSAGTGGATAPPPLPMATSAPNNVGGFTVAGATIQADPTNNALVVMAPEPVYNNIRAIVEKLDLRRAQVFIEALIVEITADRAAELGIQWQYLNGYNNSNDASTRVVGGTNFGVRGTGTNIIDVAAQPGSAAIGLNFGIMRGTVTIPGLGTITNLGLLVRALDADNNANILSTPNLLTLDNEEARIIVGQNVPFITGQYAQTGTTATVTPFQTVERHDVGLMLRIKPQISEGGTVRLSLYEEVSRIGDKTNPAGIITDKRSLESTVLVDDGQIIVLGGLIQDTTTDNASKVPVLGDLPGVGTLFRYDNRARTKSNLMVFLRPTIIRNSSASSALTSDRYDYVIDQQKRTQPEFHPGLPYIGTPQLPDVPLSTSPKVPAPSLLPPPDPPKQPFSLFPPAAPPEPAKQ